MVVLFKEMRKNYELFDQTFWAIKRITTPLHMLVNINTDKKEEKIKMSKVLNGGLVIMQMILLISKEFLLTTPLPHFQSKIRHCDNSHFKLLLTGRAFYRNFHNCSTYFGLSTIDFFNSQKSLCLYCLIACEGLQNSLVSFSGCTDKRSMTNVYKFQEPMNSANVQFQQTILLTPLAALSEL